MKFGTHGAFGAARHSAVGSSFGARAFAMGALLSSVATTAVAQGVQPASPPSTSANPPVVTVSPGSTNTQSTERTTQQSPGATPPAPQADQVASPQTGSTVLENAPRAPQDQGLGAIIVTATKRETNLQRTPIAISVANTQALTDRHVQNLVALADGSIPSLRVATFEARNSALTVGIRGIVPFDQNQTARDPGVGVYVDGIYLGKSQGLNATLLDVDRIEVLRGPQGTLFGRNTEGGAVSIITKAPTGVLGMRGTVGVGNYGSYQGQLHVDLPAFYDFALKFDAMIDHTDATVKNPLAGQLGWNYHNTVGGRVSGRWTPVDGLTVDLSYDRVKDETTPNFSQLVNYNPNGYTVGVYVLNAAGNGYVLAAPGSVRGAPACSTCIRPLSPLLVVSGDHRQRASEIGTPQQPSVDRTSGFNGTIKYKVTPDLELRSITGYREVGTHQWDANAEHRTTFSPYGLFSRYSLSELYQHQFSQEFQAVGNISHQLDYVAGLYYYWEKATELAATPSALLWNADGTAYTVNSENGAGIPYAGNLCSNTTRVINGINVAIPNQGWNRPEWCVQRDSHAHAKSYAAFGQATWTPPGFDIFHLTVGARYTHDKRDGILDEVNGKTTPPYTFTFDQSRVDPLVVLALDATPDVHLYAKYSTGYRAGGANDRSATFAAFGPESVHAYEIGGKFDFWDHRARLNLAGYIMPRKGTQTDFDNVDTNPNSPTFNLHTEETRNAAGTTKIHGLEADFTIRPINELTLGASYTYTYFKVPPTPNPFIAGNPLFPVNIVYTPRHAAAGYADYEIPTNISNGKVRLHLDANYASSQYSFQAESVKTDPSFDVNARIALADVELNQGSTLLTFALWARNLTNNTYIYRRSAANSVAAPSFTGNTPNGKFNYGGVLGDYANFNPPRTWGAEISFKVGAPRHAAVYTPPVPLPPPPPATVTCESGAVVTAPGVCPPSPPPPPPPPPPAPERGS